MGQNCSNDKEKARSDAIGSHLRQEGLQESRVLKILLLGTGESGKSTIFKQARALFGKEFSGQELDIFKPKVFHNIVGQFQAVIDFRRQEEIPLENDTNADQEELLLSIEKAQTLPTLENDSIDALRALWNDRGIQRVWERRGEFQVYDCLEYFLNENNLNRIEEEGGSYRPTFMDALQCRDRTTGITTEKLRLNDLPFELYDVGGQRTERRKWLNCFDNVTTVIFVSAINEYDQTLFEARDVNRTEEALHVWEDVVNRVRFRDIGFVLFLNKWDIFKRKVCMIPYKVEGLRNTDYSGENPMDYEDGSEEQEQAILECFEHIKGKFLAKVNMAGRRGIVEAYQTVATDNQNMGKVFDTCQHQLMRNALTGGGFAALDL